MHDLHKTHDLHKSHDLCRTAFSTPMPVIYQAGETLGAQKTMNTTQRLLHLAPRPTLRISEIERLIRVHRIVVPPLSRRTLYDMCEEGIFEFAPRKQTGGYYVYEDSFLAWVEAMGGKV